MARLLVAALAASLLAGCGGVEHVQSTPPLVALAYGEEIADLDAQLAGVRRAADDEDTRKAADDLWRETIRTATELPKGIDAEGPVGGTLLTAAEEARFAAQALEGARRPPDNAAADGHLRRSSEALTAAADALAGRLPSGSGPDLDKLRAALPPG